MIVFIICTNWKSWFFSPNLQRKGAFFLFLNCQKDFTDQKWHIWTLRLQITLCRLIYPGLCIQTNVFNHYHRIQRLWYLQNFRLSLQLSSVWRHLWMVLQTIWNASRRPVTSLTLSCPYSLRITLCSLIYPSTHLYINQDRWVYIALYIMNMDKYVSN